MAQKASILTSEKLEQKTLNSAGKSLKQFFTYYLNGFRLVLC